MVYILSNIYYDAKLKRYKILYFGTKLSNFAQNTKLENIVNVLLICLGCFGTNVSILGTYGVTKNNSSGIFLTIYWIQTQYIILLGEQVLTIFLCIKRVRLNWNLIVNDVQSATYSSDGGPLSYTRFIPMAKHENECTYISMDNTRISEKTFSVPLGFGWYFLTIAYVQWQFIAYQMI